jgi:hypothetical protein
MLKGLVTFLLLAGLTRSTPSLAESELDNLKGVHKLLLTAVEQSNLPLLETLVHPLAIGFFPEGLSPMILTREYRVKEAAPAILADLAKFTSTVYENEYRIFGTTGVVCTHANRQPKEGSKSKTRFLRSTYIFSKVNDKWLLTSWHTSDIPVKK